MSEFLQLKHLNDLHSLCSSKEEEREVLLNAISDLFDADVSCQTIETLISKSDFNHSLNNY